MTITQIQILCISAFVCAIVEREKLIRYTKALIHKYKRSKARREAYRGIVQYHDEPELKYVPLYDYWQEDIE